MHTTAELFAAYERGEAITESLAALYAADGIDHGRQVLTAAEFAAVAAHAATLPSTPANNVWD